MTFRLMKQLLVDPVSAINDAKRSIKETNTAKLLIAEWIFIGIGLGVALLNFGLVPAFGAAVALATIGIVVSLFVAFLVQIVFTNLGGKGNYMTGLTSLVYAKFPLAVGILIASFLFRTPFFGIVLGAFVLVIMATMTLSLLYRALKDLFKTDIITTWIGIGVVILSVVVALYLSIILLSANSPVFLSFLHPGMFNSTYSPMMWA